MLWFFMYEISASLLAADMGCLGREVVDVTAAGADRIHVDIIDGTFAPNISFGARAVEVARRFTHLPIEVHLMVANTDFAVSTLAPDVARYGADIIIVHSELVLHLDKVLGQIRSLGKKVGVALNPATHPRVLEYVLPKLDQILIMTVNPGFSGQKFMEPLTKKIVTCREMIKESGFNIEIAVDGGMNHDTVSTVIGAGANIIVAAASIFGHNTGGGYVEAIERLRNGV